MKKKTKKKLHDFGNIAIAVILIGGIVIPIILSLLTL